MTNGNFRQIINQLDMRWRRRVPVIHQTETAECGLACSAMICGHFGKNIDLISLRRKFNLGPWSKPCRNQWNSGATGDGHPGSFTGAG